MQPSLQKVIVTSKHPNPKRGSHEYRKKRCCDFDRAFENGSQALPAFRDPPRFSARPPPGGLFFIGDVAGSLSTHWGGRSRIPVRRDQTLATKVRSSELKRAV